MRRRSAGRVCRHNGRSFALLRRVFLAHRIMKAVGPAGLDQLLAAHKAQLAVGNVARDRARSEEHTSELQSLIRISYAVCCLKKKTSIRVGISRTGTGAN